jgi:uncharacterized protein (TIGR02147 family)
MTTLSPATTEDLLRTDDYREFLKDYLEKTRIRNRPVNLADLARKAQFSSRSFVSDVLRGKRRITPSSLPRFKQALGLTGAWAQYFELLVMLSENDCRPARQTDEKTCEKIDAVRKKIRDK